MVSPPAAPSEPPLNDASCAHAQTGRPWTRPLPASTPSPTALRTGRKVPGSKSSSSRARAARCSGATSNTALTTAPPSRRRQHQGRVLAAESERVAQRDLEVGRLARRAGDVVGRAVRVDLLEAERRRQRAAAQRLDARDGLDRAGGPERVAGRALARRDRRAVVAH